MTKSNEWPFKCVASLTHCVRMLRIQVSFRNKESNHKVRKRSFRESQSMSEQANKPLGELGKIVVLLDKSNGG